MLAVELQTDELTLHYEDDGDEAAPPILLLHGITQSTATWGWLVPHLPDHRVQHPLVQLALVPDVGVERGCAGVELRSDRTHGDRLEAQLPAGMLPVRNPRR